MDISYRKKVCLGLVLASLIWISAARAQADTFSVSLSSSGQAQGDGSGYNRGQWYYYPTSGGTCSGSTMAHYNPDGYKKIDWSLRVAPIDTYAGSRVTIAINWSTDQWKRPRPLLFPAISPTIPVWRTSSSAARSFRTGR